MKLIFWMLLGLAVEGVLFCFFPDLMAIVVATAFALAGFFFPVVKPRNRRGDRLRRYLIVSHPHWGLASSHRRNR